MDMTPILLRLRTLSSAHQIVFGACCTERLLPNYAAFHWIEGWGNPTTLRTALDLAWSFALGTTISHSDFNLAIQECIVATPDIDDFHSAFTGCAMRAAACVVYVLESCLKLPTQIDWVVEETFESIRQYLSIMSYPVVVTHEASLQLIDWVESSPIMKFEFDQQLEALAHLETVTTFNISTVRQLQETARLGGIQPIQRGITPQLYR